MKFPSQILLLCAFFCGGTLFAQKKPITKKDTSVAVDSTKFFFFYENGFGYGNFPLEFPLTNKLDGFQIYHPRQAALGNAGAPEKQLHLPGPQPDAFSWANSYFSWFGYGPQTRHFYDSEKPYTKLQYIVGQKQETNVSVVHAHPFGKNCNIAFGFDRVRSTGFYRRQNSNNTSVNLNGWYRSPSRRYAMLADLYWTDINVAENGGIRRDSSFEFASQLDRQLVSINLSAATTKQRFRGVWLKQYWSFGNVVDTLSDKSDSTELRTKISPRWAIVHTVFLRDEVYHYLDSDPAGGFYETIYNDSTQTNDSTYLWRIENGLWLERFQHRPKDIFGKIGVRYESGELISDSVIYRHFQNLYLDGRLNWQTGRGYLGYADGWYILSGYNAGDYRAAADFGKPFHYGAHAEVTRMHPAMIYTTYYGNHFRWENDFSSPATIDANAYWMKPFGKDPRNWLAVMAGWKNYDHPLYFDSTLLPAQYNGYVSAFYANLQLNIGTAHFRTRSDITYNQLPSSSPIRLPQLLARESIYGDFHLFKSALQLQTGIDATWFSAYYGDAYNPNLSQFYIQNTKEIGNYVFLDAWVSIKVKPVRVFVKADHINAGLMGRNYYLVPHYPGNDFALKFGASWVFND